MPTERLFVVLSATPLTRVSSGAVLGTVVNVVQPVFVEQSTTRTFVAVVPNGSVGAGVCSTVTVPVPPPLTRMFIE